MNDERDETMALRKALQECKACNIKRPECGDDPPPCFPRVECRDTYDGPVCGPCPTGFKVKLLSLQVTNEKTISDTFCRAMANFAKGTRVARTHVIRESSVTTLTRNLSSGVGHVQRVTAEMECAVFPQPASNGRLHVSK